MIRLSCARISVLLERRQSGLSDGERLLVERHLEACATCAGEANALERAVELLQSSVSLTESSRHRALDVALAAKPAAPAARATRFEVRASVAVALAMAAAIAMVVWAVGGPAGSAPTAQALDRAVPAVRGAVEQARIHVGDLVVLSGRARAGDAPLAPGNRLDSALALSAETRTAIRAAHARMELEPGSVVRWRSERSSLRLEAGRVQVDVEPSRRRAFLVETQNFRVEVIGTSFTVSLDEVRVSRGRVRVLAGAVERTLGPGESWTAEPATAALSSKPGAPVENVSALLASARRLLASGEVQSAKAELARALAARPSAQESAEARSLLAECALVGGDREEAQRRYAAVARQHAGTSAGETALFAAARLERDPARARVLLEDYLRRYPAGRFRSEAQARLKQLSNR